MGWTVLYIAFGVVALWLLGEVLLQYKARLRWRLLAFCGFSVVVVGVLLSSVLVIGGGIAAFAVGQTFVTLSYRRGFSTGWALGGLPGSSQRRREAAPDADPALEVSDLEAHPPPPGPPGGGSASGGFAPPGPPPEAPGHPGSLAYAEYPGHPEYAEFAAYPEYPGSPDQPPPGGAPLPPDGYAPGGPQGPDAPLGDGYPAGPGEPTYPGAPYDDGSGWQTFPEQPLAPAPGQPWEEPQPYAAYSDPYIGYDAAAYASGYGPESMEPGYPTGEPAPYGGPADTGYGYDGYPPGGLPDPAAPGAPPYQDGYGGQYDPHLGQPASPQGYAPGGQGWQETPPGGVWVPQQRDPSAPLPPEQPPYGTEFGNGYGAADPLAAPHLDPYAPEPVHAEPPYHPSQPYDPYADEYPEHQTYRQNGYHDGRGY
ncbi:hypothetical protein [Streptomyces sp. AJS327]|uniref:hypothetical protein n=1 Tax=Streptomyces sp. AJS327 TaxID=2545265 RepID=UPI0015DE4138|nr:hypothetical protein [Streptomyces sp. AJS327]